MSDCPLVRLATNLKLLKQLETWISDNDPRTIEPARVNDNDFRGGYGAFRNIPARRFVGSFGTLADCNQQHSSGAVIAIRASSRSRSYADSDVSLRSLCCCFGAGSLYAVAGGPVPPSFLYPKRFLQNKRPLSDSRRPAGSGPWLHVHQHYLGTASMTLKWETVGATLLRRRSASPRRLSYSSSVLSWPR
jgi:hypothetical protein